MLFHTLHFYCYSSSSLSLRLGEFVTVEVLLVAAEEKQGTVTIIVSFRIISATMELVTSKSIVSNSSCDVFHINVISLRLCNSPRAPVSISPGLISFAVSDHETFPKLVVLDLLPILADFLLAV